ncbi:tRNA glutamyl-Q(34) synthetase GluQRS [Pseudohoeflea suaedae]|nr:tRNA glutamyl-Q(34) synthetase GluQRS [Pseudohoeflea suaedae]
MHAPTRKPIVRFAPSPNGLLHLGHARSALLNWRFAQDHAGTFLLRIEDIDRERCRPEFEQAIFEDLAWLGLSWPAPARRQSDRFDVYRAALTELERLGLVYPAFLSRAEIRTLVREKEESGEAWPRDPDGAPLYPGTERDLPADRRAARIGSGAPFAWRLDMKRAIEGLKTQLLWQEAHESGGDGAAHPADPAKWGDVILARRDTPASYHLSVVLDDDDQGITDVIRGRDLFEATAIHRLLQEILGLDQPVYRHHRLVADESGRKLSKSDADTALAALRNGGSTAADIARMAGIGAELRPFPSPA